MPIYAQERVDLNAIHKIREEALQNSKAMEHVFQLTDVYGPRLTNSPGYFAAADWIVKQLKDWGIEGRQEKWGPFGRGWTFTHFSANLIEPQYAPLIGFPLAWSPGTNGTVTSEAMVANIAAETDFERYKGKLKDKILFMGVGRELAMITTSLGQRYTDDELAKLSVAAEGGGRGGAAPGTAALGDGRGGRGGRGGAGGRGRSQCPAAVPEQAESIFERRGRGHRGSNGRRAEQRRHRIRPGCRIARRERRSPASHRRDYTRALQPRDASAGR
jgi:hypothetical protein